MYFISNIEMFVDHFLIDNKENTALKLHTPEKKEISIQFDLPHECPTSAYVTVLHFQNKYYMYYRGLSYDNKKGEKFTYTCLALSDDGIHFYKPSLKLIEHNGSKDNNIILKNSDISHNFTPFVDTNPDCKKDEIIKAVGGIEKIGVNRAKLYGLSSKDGIHFKKIAEAPIKTDGMFDSQNVAFYDHLINRYRCYSRYFDTSNLEKVKEYEGIRSIQSSISKDFINWEENIQNKYNTHIKEEFYTNATVICKNTNHYLSFPKRYVKARERDFYNAGDTGVSDCLFMSSRDGINWDRSFMEAYVRPGLDRKNWVNRNNMMAVGIIDTSDTEFSMFISENYRTDTSRIRRLSIRKYGFASLHAGYKKGSMLTKVFAFNKNKLLINYSTSAVGYVKVTLLDQQKNVLAVSDKMYGDEIFEAVQFDKEISEYRNQAVRLLFELKDSDLFAFTFEEESIL